ncbi:DUF493 domain-containing protein [bacterium]|nr:MAG: DUF493 domain-containing protein [bacterium]
MSETERPRIEFPCEDYPIKVVARESDDVRDRVDAVFTRHFGAFPRERVAERASAQANFVAFTYLMTVRDVEQLGALHAELKTHSDVVMVL